MAVGARRKRGTSRTLADVLRAMAQDLLRASTRAAQQVVGEALAARDRRGERSIQIATVDIAPGSVRPATPVTGMTYVDVTCQPSGLQLVAQVMQATRGNYGDPLPGDVVLVAVPRGDLQAPAVMLGWLSSARPTQTPPVPVAGPTAQVMEHLTGPIEIRAPLGVAVTGAAGVALNGPGGLGVARIGDTVAMSAELIAYLAALAAAVPFPGPPAMPTTAGTISSGSATVTAGA